MPQKFHKIRGNNLEEAYQQVRTRFGPDAVVVATQQVNEGGVLGFFGRKRIEVTVSAPAQNQRPLSMPERHYAQQSQAGSAQAQRQNVEPGTVAYFEQIVRDAQQRMNTPQPQQQSQPQQQVSTGAGNPVVPFPKPRPQPGGEKQELQREVAEIREMLQVLYAEHPAAGLPPDFAPYYRKLIARGVTRKVAAALLGRVVKNSDPHIVRDPRVFSERLRMEIRRVVRVTGGIRLESGKCRVVAVVGATGVGKTTSLAKLAALYAVRERARVALVTADTYRVAAPEQLRVYANIIGLPLSVVNNAKEMARAVKDHAQFDLLLVDTAGGSQFNLEQINELKGLLQAARPHETLLVMSANTQMEDLRNAANNFRCLGPTGLFFTKLDETRQYGAPFSLLCETGLPLSYLSIGQNVPDDLRVAAPQSVARLVLEGKYSG